VDLKKNKQKKGDEKAIELGSNKTVHQMEERITGKLIGRLRLRIGECTYVEKAIENWWFWEEGN